MTAALGLHIAQVALAVEPDEDVASRLLEIAGADSRIHETEHFIIAYGTPFSVLRPLTGRLEGTYDAVLRFCNEHNLALAPPPSRLQLLLFDDPEEYSEYCATLGRNGASSSGVYAPEANISAFLNTMRRAEIVQITREIHQATARAEEGPGAGPSAKAARERRKSLLSAATSLRIQRDRLVERFNRFVIQHEAAHQILFNLGIHQRERENPFWLVEGMACLFEVPQIGAAGTTRQVNHMRLGDFRDALGVPAAESTLTEAQYRAALDAARLVPLRALITRQDLFLQPHGDVPFRYAQAWALVYYLSRERREDFAGYLRRRAARGTPARLDPEFEVKAFEAAFGGIDAEMERNWIDFILRLRFDANQAGR